MKKALQMIRDWLIMSAMLILIVWSLMIGMANAEDTEVPDCPPEYEGGLIP